MRTIAACVAAAAFATVFCGAAGAETYKVSDLKAVAQLLGEKANPGDVIEIQPGTYYLEEKWIRVLKSGSPESPIVVRGVIKDGKRPIIDASKVNVQRSVFRVEEGVHDVVFENLEICNAVGSRFPEQKTYGVNATAIYFTGCNNITVRNCNSHDNEDGFFANEGADYILIENSEIHHNGTHATAEHNRTHNFYFCAKHQMVKNCYIHDTFEGENFKSRGANTIFAFNWVDEEAIYSVAVDSGNGMNTLWLGNVIMKRSTLGASQGRLLGVGDGTGVARGKLVALNNTFITKFPRDFYLFTFRSSTTDVILMNNAFDGPGEWFLDHNGQGAITGTNDWISDTAENVPYAIKNVIRGEDAGFADPAGADFRLKAGSPLIDKGATGEEYVKAIHIVTDNSRTGTDVSPSPMWLKAIEEIEKPTPAYEPVRKDYGFQTRPADGAVDIGAYEFVKSDGGDPAKFTSTSSIFGFDTAWPGEGSPAKAASTDSR